MQQADSLHPAHVSRIVGHRGRHRDAATSDAAASVSPKTAALPVPAAVVASATADDHRDADPAQNADEVANLNAMSLLHGTFAVADAHDTSLDRLNSVRPPPPPPPPPPRG